MLLTGKRVVRYSPYTPMKRRLNQENPVSRLDRELDDYYRSMGTLSAPIEPPVIIPAKKSFACKLTNEEVVNDMMNELTAKVETWMESNKKCLPRTRSKLCSALKFLCFLSAEINFDILFCAMLTKQVIEVSYTADLLYKKLSHKKKPTVLQHQPTISSFYQNAIDRISSWIHDQNDGLPKTKDALQKRIQPFLIVRISVDPEFLIQKLIDKGWIAMVGDAEGHYVYKEVKLEEHTYVSSPKHEDDVEEEEE